MTKKALIMLYMTFLLFFGVITPAQAQSRYTLENLITNGDFSNGKTGWTSDTGSISITDGIGKIVNNGSNTYSRLISLSTSSPINNTDILYQKVKFRVLDNLTLEIRITRTREISLIVNPVQYQWYDISVSSLSNSFYSEPFRLQVYYDNPTNQSYGSFEFDNIMVFNLTATFGAGNEPSLEDFEKYYLPDIEYFERYEGLKMRVGDDVILDGLIGLTKPIITLLTLGTFSMTIENITEENSSQVISTMIIGIIVLSSALILTSYVYNILKRRP